MFKEGDMLNQQYVLVEAMSQGNNSMTFRAIKLGDPNPNVVIKTISHKAPSIITSAKRGAKILMENLASDDRYPEFIEVFDENQEGIQEQYTCFVKRFIPGRPLSEELERTTQLSSETVYDWVTQLCDLVGNLHKKNPQILFMDLKPENIVVCPDQTIRLVDFSSAIAVVSGPEQESGFTATPEYTDPALIGYGVFPDVKADIFGLGKVIQRIIGYLKDEEYEIAEPLLEIAGRCCGNREARFDSIEALEKEIKKARKRSVKIRNGDEGKEYETNEPAKLGKLGFGALLIAGLLVICLFCWIKEEPHRMGQILLKIKSPQFLTPFLLVVGLLIMRITIVRGKKAIVVRREAILNIPMDMMITSLAYVATTGTIAANTGVYYSLLILIMIFMTLGICSLSSNREKEILDKGFFFGDNAGYSITIFLIAFTAFGLAVLLQ